MPASENKPEEEEKPPPSASQRRRFDRRRRGKQVSNRELTSPTDPDCRIALMKDGTAHLAYKTEHVVDLEYDAILGAEVYHADVVDTATGVDSVVEAQTHLNKSGIEKRIEEVRRTGATTATRRWRWPSRWGCGRMYRSGSVEGSVAGGGSLRAATGVL